MSRRKNIVGVHARPNGIERLEPVEEVGILRGRDGACEGLVKVMVRIDQTRQDDMPFEIEHFIGSGWQAGRLPDLLNKTIADENSTVRNFGLVVIHGNNIYVFD